MPCKHCERFKQERDAYKSFYDDCGSVDIAELRKRAEKALASQHDAEREVERLKREISEHISQMNRIREATDGSD